LQRASKIWLVIAVVLGLVAATSCSNSEETGGDGGGDDEAASVDAPGVTDSEIRVRGVVSATNPYGAKFADTYHGVDAYFQMINEDEGGMYGRQLVVDEPIDDRLGGNEDAVNELLTQDEPFAVMPVASPLFTGNERLTEAGVPTFGWTLGSEWRGTAEVPKDNLFGQAGVLCTDCPTPMPPHVAELAGADTIGLLAYNVPQSSECATGVERSFDQYTAPGAPTVGFVDKTLPPLTTELASQVSQMKDAGVDLVITCMDSQGVITLAREMQRQQLDAPQYLLNAYDPETVGEFSDLFQGSYVLTFFAPFETAEPPEGLTQFLDWMEQLGYEPNESAMNGWLNAALFVEGLRRAGEDFSRESVIAEINRIDNWTADGLLAHVDWTTAHTDPMDPVCYALSRIEGEEFVPVAEDGPFTCLNRDQQGVPATTTPPGA
jgi:branched-chain amino acid transport system substrate-binding protein